MCVRVETSFISHVFSDEVDDIELQDVNFGIRYFFFIDVDVGVEGRGVDISFAIHSSDGIVLFIVHSLLANKSSSGFIPSYKSRSRSSSGEPPGIQNGIVTT